MNGHIGDPPQSPITRNGACVVVAAAALVAKAAVVRKSFVVCIVHRAYLEQMVRTVRGTFYNELE